LELGSLSSVALELDPWKLLGLSVEASAEDGGAGAHFCSSSW
jgi:hypothetical protein